MGLHRLAIGRILDMHPALLTSDPHVYLYPVFDFLLNEVGIPFPDIAKTISRCPRLLVSSVSDQLRPALIFLRNLGSPGLLTFSVENNLVPKVEYFLVEMKGDLEELKRFPQYFSFSLEGKIKPRHRMLAEYGLKLPLCKMLKISDGEFSARLVDMRLRMVGET
ncbi:hypothetical protein GH714_031000 [Hevea brasiliensis]|uniref:Uncharacterized protein n=1 Tax=Hevea brasiliensis TaxID=3981 RepID=A0A6A6LCS1_HEVBR|nr:hypothetical protein GH714_031000 [Hevea brasiliensis]